MPKLIVGNRTIECSLVIFDKDGTLVDYRTVDLALAKARRKSVERVVGKDAADLWEKAVGIDTKSGKFDYHGPLATLPSRDEVLVTATAFYLKGYSWDDAKNLAGRAYAEADKSMEPPYGAVLLKDVEKALKKLKEHGFKLAIASTDARSRTVISFKILKVDRLFDVFVGPEDVANGKPAPDMILEILKRTDCSAQNAVMIGDSLQDIKMGRNAEVRACIGVLTGITARADLERSADVVIDSVARINVS